MRNRRFASAATPKPFLIITPLFETHVQAAILCSKLTGKQLKIRSGAHDYEGLSYVSPAGVAFIILDTMYLRSISLDTTTNTAWVQSGATLGELYFKIASISKTHGFPAGACSTVAFGGHLGCGNMLRKYELLVDNVLDARIVDVNGRVLDRKAMDLPLPLAFLTLPVAFLPPPLPLPWKLEIGMDTFWLLGFAMDVGLFFGACFPVSDLYAQLALDPTKALIPLMLAFYKTLFRMNYILY
ncbi:hypothetical protein HYC85_024096 [Camellia sinensis]|uniref:FAD-binding PCMH-type domain-containing protein n=1 Tax=Camellia sinensis TaxID=4442 RepID=A0A7J7G740_CAMSI|nr:hypothetical protein HYC85_024096 [Camellia sinensis]